MPGIDLQTNMEYDQKDPNLFLNIIDNHLKQLLVEINELRRPRVFFNILPNKNKTSILDVVLKNAGGTPAYDIILEFDPDIPYYDDLKLSELPIFKNLPYLEQGQLIEFALDSFSSYLQNPDKPKKVDVKIKYHDSKGKLYEERYIVDIGRYQKLLGRDESSTKEIVKELENVRKQLEYLNNHGIVFKSSTDFRPSST